MATQHSTLTGADLHEVKGAAGATAGHVYSSDGAGSASFVDPTTLINTEYTSVISNFKTTNILPGATDTPLQASFDSTLSNSDVNMDSSGTITTLTEGLYRFTFNLNFGRTGNTGTAMVVARLLINDVQFGFTQGATIDTSANTSPSQIDVIYNAAANDTFKVQVMRDSAGNNDGGLVGFAVTDSGWVDVRPYWVRVAKLLGAA